jgi:dihydropteroate synthase
MGIYWLIAQGYDWYSSQKMLISVVKFIQYLISKARYINVRGNLLDLNIPRVMGIINCTPDSFYHGSRLTGEKEIIETAIRMTGDGADIIDIGGYSSRPGAADVPAGEELRRVEWAVKLVLRELPDAVISVDTFRSDVARAAVSDFGACMVNDISGGEMDDKMLKLVEEINVPYILMHMQGTPRNMQENPVYDDVVADILRWFGRKISRLQSAGVKDIIIDPGFGFGKTTEHNFEILRRLGEFSVAGLPLLAGVSRKGMVWKTLGITAGEALNGTTVLNTTALMHGADILRVHDVREAVQAVKLFLKIKEGECNPINQPAEK